MAIRQIRTLGDPVLEKKCREVKEMTPRLQELVDDMLETMYQQDGVGLAAPQVGVLRRIAVVDTGLGEPLPEEEAAAAEETPAAEAPAQAEPKNENAARPAHTHDAPEFSDGPLILINPVVVETDGEQKGAEGCLSVPGQAGEVTRPDYVKVKAFDRQMQPYTVEGVGLLARALCHEIDHLDGIMYVTKVEGGLYDVKEDEE